MPPRPSSSAPPADARHVRVAIIGSGFGGLGMGIRLKQEGRHDFVVLERAEDVGGVWRDNHYPGAACDVQSHLYAFSFAPKPDWSRRFAPQHEIWQYQQDCVDRFGLRPHLRLGHEVTRAAWDAEAARWRLATSRGPYTADVLVAAPGALAEPRRPDLPGLDAFDGPAFHTSRWPTGLEIAGRRVAVVGTGASAIQVVPTIQPIVQHLTLFQRTPPWVMPRHDRALGDRTRRWLTRVPGLQRLLREAIYTIREGMGLAFRHLWLARLIERVARRHLRRQVPDPALRAALTPDYTLGCKRILLSDTYYPALTRPNVTVVPGGATAVTTGGVVGPDGTEHPADVLVFATGFHVADFPLAGLVHGRDGRSLAEAWQGSPEAYVGTTVHGYPNLFLLMGPNTGLGHSSVLLMLEAQIEHVLNALAHLDATGAAAVEPTAEAQAAFVAEVDRQMEQTVWVAGGCESWYLDATGRNATLWPGSIGAFRRRVEPFDPAAYRLHPTPSPVPA